MFKRCLTGAIIVAVTVGFFLLRIIDVRLFNIFVCFFAVLGTYELFRAFKPFAFKRVEKIAAETSATTAELTADENADRGNVSTDAAETTATAQTTANVGKPCAGNCLLTAVIAATTVLFVPVYTFFGAAWSAVVLGAGLIAVLAVKAFSHGAFGKELGYSALILLYPNALLFSMLVANSIGAYSTLALVLIFVISPLADTFAYLVGSMIGGKKLCPKISPNKTVSGAIGGLAGGAIGALILYFIFKPATTMPVPWLIFILIGIVGAVFTEEGDLFESLLKRKAGIKDMGKLLPGHGGVMDRIDGILFASVLITVIFLLI